MKDSALLLAAVIAGTKRQGAARTAGMEVHDPGTAWAATHPQQEDHPPRHEGLEFVPGLKQQHQGQLLCCKVLRSLFGEWPVVLAF